MAFDPDEYLNETGASSTATAEFDPDAYLKETEEQEAPFDPDDYLSEVKPPSIGGLAVPPAPEVPKFEAAKPSEGVLRQAADLPVQFAIGINNSVKGLSDLFGADNPVSKNLSQNVDWYRGLLSAASKQDEEEVGRILQEAENKGLLDQLGAGLEAFSVAPADFVASGLGSLAVFAAGGLASRAAGLGAKGIQAVQAGLGAGMGAGIAKGEIYQSVKDEMLAQGKTEEEAKGIAMEAQSFGGKNLDQILVAAGLGAVDAFTGAEKIIGKVLAKGGLKPDASRVGNILKTGISEAVPEFAQAAQEKFASNLALNREGVNVPLTQGVFSQGALEGLVGLGLGVGGGAIEPRIQTEPTKEEVAAAAAETQDVARQSMDVAPATASLVEGEAEQIIKSQAETPDERVARLQREAQEAAGEIELEEEDAGLPPQPVTPTPEAPSVEPVAPVEPVVPAEGAVEPTVAEVAPTRRLADLEVRPPTDNVQQVAAANDLTVGRADVNIPAQELESTVNLSDPKERERVDRLKEQISSEGGFISRVIVDGQNNVVEGQHRVQAMKELGYDQIPAVQLKSAEDFIPDSNALDKVMQDAGLTASDNLAQMRQLIAEIISDEKGDVTQLREYEAPAGFETAWNAATEEVIRQNTAPEAAPVTPEAAVAPTIPQLEPLRRVARAEQTEEDVAGLVDAGFAEVYKGQPVLTQAGLDALPEAERPRLTPEARKIQIDTGVSEVAAEAISKNLRIGVDQIDPNVRMPAGWTLVDDIYIPPAVEAAPEAVAEPEIAPEQQELDRIKTQYGAAFDWTAAAIARGYNFEAEEVTTLPENYTKEIIGGREIAVGPVFRAEREQQRKLLAELNSIERSAISGRLVDEGIISKEDADRYFFEASAFGAEQQQISDAEEIANQKWDDKKAAYVAAGTVAGEVALPPVDHKAEEAERAKQPKVNPNTALDPEEFNGLTVREALLKLASMNFGASEYEATGRVLSRDMTMQRVASALAKLPLRGLDAERVLTEGFRGTALAYRSNAGDIFIPKTDGGKKAYLSPATLIHEIGHTLTLDAFNKYIDASKRKGSSGEGYYNELKKSLANKATPPPVKKLISLYIETIDQLGLREMYFGKKGLADIEGPRSRKRAQARDVKPINPITGKPFTFNQLYGLSNIDEFVSEIFSEPSFQDFVKTIPSKSGTTSTWRKFVEAIRELLGLPSKSIAEQVISATIRTAALEAETITGRTIEQRLQDVADAKKKKIQQGVADQEKAKIKLPWKSSTSDWGSQLYNTRYNFPKGNPIADSVAIEIEKDATGYGGYMLAFDGRKDGATVDLSAFTKSIYGISSLKRAKEVALDLIYNISLSSGRPAPTPEVREARREPAITPQQDADYLAAVEGGDLDAASRMVEDAARAAGYNVLPLFHGTEADTIKKFRKKLSGIWLAFKKEMATPSSGERPTTVINAYADLGSNPITLTDEQVKEWQRSGSPLKWMRDFRLENRATAVIIGDYATVVFQPSQVKSADPVTYDNQGNIIPLSQRFQPEEADIRYARRDIASIQQQYAPKTNEEQQSFDRASTNKILARSPQLAVAAVRLKNGEITAGEYADLVDVLDPFVVKGAEPVPTNEKIYQYMSQTAGGKPTSEQGKKKLAKIGAFKEDGTQRIPNGKLAEFRIDIPTYNESTKNGDTVYSITGHEPVSETATSVGETIAHLGIAKITNPQFITRTISGKGDAIQIAMGAGKFPLATVKGNYEAITELPADINDPNVWTETGYNPVRSSELVDVRSKKALVGGTEAIMVGSRVFVKNAQLEARPTGITMGERYGRRVQMGRAGMEQAAVEARLQELGFPAGGIIRVVNQPDADFEGRTIIVDGKVTGIELNAAAMRDNATIDRVLNHEFAESANADGALNRLVERLTPKEKKEINDTITRLRYEERARTAEEAARAIETLAEAWKGRGFFTRAVARVEAWASKLGFKLTRRAAEYIAARNLAEVNENVRKWHIGEAMANLKGARRVIVDGIQAILIPPSEMRVAYSIAAYHGTPHEIKGRFQVAKIGTGEGATVYGWGLYFAENIDVALEYKNRLAKELRYAGSEFDNKNPSHVAADRLAMGKFYGKSREEVIQELENDVDYYADNENTQAKQWSQQIVQILKDNNEAKIERVGNIYSVDLDVAEDQLMDWDKPLSEQNPEVRKKLEPFLPPALQKPFEKKTIQELIDEDPTIQYVYRYLVAQEMKKTSFLDMFRSLSNDEKEFRAKQKVSEALRDAGIIGIRYLDQGSRFAQPKKTGFGWLVDDYRGSNYFKTKEEAITFAEEAQTRNYVIFDEDVISITGRNGQPVDIRESRREPEAIPTFTEGTPEAATLKEMAASMAKVDAASEAKGGKPETYKISEIASVWMDSGLGERELQDAITEYTNLTPANAAKVAKAIAKQYGIQQQLVEAAAPLAEIAPEPEGAPRKSAVTKLIEQTTGVRKPVVKLQVSESAALKKQIQLKAREARETRKARKEAAEDLAKSITDYVKANPIRGPINSRQAMSITKKALKLDVNNEAAVDRFEMYVERVIENANYDRDLADARSLIKRAKTFAKAKDTQGNVKTTLEAIANISPTLLDNPFEFNLVVQRYLLGLAPVTAKQYAVMPDADVRRYLESLETQIKDNQEVLDRAKAQRILDKQAAYAEERGIPLDEAISILNSEEFLNEKTVEKLEDLTRLLTSMAQESQKDVKAYDDSGATPKQKELISFMRKVNIDSLINEEKKRYIRFANNLLANGATFGMEQFQSIALGQEAAMRAVKDRRLSSKLAAWISPIGGDKAIDTARRIALRTQSEADTFKNIFGREAVGAFRNILGLNRLDSAQTDSNRAKEQIANEFGEYFKGLRKKYGDDATGFEAKGYAGIAGYLIQTDGNKTEAESIPYRRRLMEQNIAELRKSDKQSDLAEADLKEKALAQLTGTTNAEILSQLQALNPASYEQLMWVKDVMLPKWRDFLKEHDENFRNQANNYNNPDHLTITYKFPEGQLLPNEIEDVYQQDMVGMRIKQAANSIKRKDHPNLPVSKAGTVANIDINFGYNQYNALVDQVDKAFVAPAWEQIVAFTKAPEFEQIMGGRANALFVKKLLVDIQTSRTRQSMTDDEAQLVAGGVRLARKISTQAVLGGFTQPLRQVPDQLSKLFFTTGRFDLITKNLLKIAEASPLMNKFPISRRGDAQAGTQYASQFSELARKVEASVTDRKWAKYRELMNKVGEFWMTPLRGSDVWAAKVSWMTYYEAYLNKQDIKMQSWEREAELVDTDQTRKDAASYAEWAVDFYGGASDPTKMASLSKQTNNGWKEFAKLLFLPLNSFALQQKNSLISDLRDAYLRTGDRKASIAAIAGTLAGMAAFHATRIYIIGGLIYPAGKALLMGIFGIDMDEPDEEEKQKQLEDNWRKFKGSMYGNIVAGGLGQFVENNMIDAFNRTAYLWDANINPDSLLNDKGEIMSFRQYEKDVSPLYRFRSYGSSEYTFGLADVLTEQATHALAETQQLLTQEEMERYTGNEQAYAAFATGVEWMYFFRLMDTDVKRIATDLKRQMDKQVEEREAEIRAIRNR